MNTRIRKADAQDLPQLVDLMIQFYDEAGYTLTPEAAARPFSTLLGQPGLGSAWIIEAGEQPAGYLVVTLGFSMEYGGRRGFVDDFFVRPERRGQGLGSAALDTVRQACRESGVAALLVETGPVGHPARGVYERAGFTDSGRVLLSQAFTAALHDQ